MKKIAKSLLESFKQAFLTNEEIRNLINKYPRIFHFSKKRIDKTKFTGLPLTVFALCFAYILVLFLSTVEDFLTADIIVQVDARVNTLLYAFRNITFVKIFTWITFFGETELIIVFVVLLAIYLWLKNKKMHIWGLFLSVAGSTGFTFFAKNIFHRLRPINAVFMEKSASFPSGHATAAVAFYGFIVYLLVRRTKKKRHRIIIVSWGAIIAILIGLSRLYLGVHYVSDVWAGYLVGLLWLILGISFTEWKISHQTQITTPTEKLSNKQKKQLSLLLAASAAGVYFVYGFSFQPKYLPPPPLTAEAVVSNIENIFSSFNLSPYTETLTGGTQEPISFIVVAKNDSSLAEHFKNAGWFKADSVNLHSVADMAKFAILNQEYITAPMTPSFWNKDVHNFGFQKSTEAKTVRQRHHARFWKTNFKTTDGENIYVGTTSLDIGLKWFITHRISPDIDTERELLFSDLQNKNTVKSFKKINLVKPELGKNFGGDPFFTDGEAYIMILDGAN